MPDENKLRAERIAHALLELRLALSEYGIDATYSRGLVHGPDVIEALKLDEDGRAAADISALAKELVKKLPRNAFRESTNDWVERRVRQRTDDASGIPGKTGRVVADFIAATNEAGRKRPNPLKSK